MTYAKVENNEVVETGTLYKLLPEVSNPIKLTNEELLDQSIYKIDTNPITLEPWQFIKSVEPVFDGEKVYLNKTIENYDLEEYKDTKKKEFKKTFQQILTEGFTTSSGIKLDCKQENINNFTNNIMFMEKMGGNQTTVRDFNNQEHTFTLQEFEDMLKELGQHWKTQFNNKWTLDKKVDVATTHQEVHDIYWRKAVHSDEMEFSHWEYHPEVQ